MTEDLNPGLLRVDALNRGPPDYNTSALNHSTTLPLMHGDLKQYDSTLKSDGHDARIYNQLLLIMAILGTGLPKMLMRFL